MAMQTVTPTSGTGFTPENSGAATRWELASSRLAMAGFGGAVVELQGDHHALERP